MQLAYPFALNNHGRIAEADGNAHIRQMIEQVLFTIPGERVNRPDFGCGIGNLVFDAMNSELLTATQALVRGSLLKWLGNLIHIEALTVESQDSKLAITIRYVVLAERQRQTDTFVG